MILLYERAARAALAVAEQDNDDVQAEADADAAVDRLRQRLRDAAGSAFSPYWPPQYAQRTQGSITDAEQAEINDWCRLFCGPPLLDMLVLAARAAACSGDCPDDDNDDAAFDGGDVDVRPQGAAAPVPAQRLDVDQVGVVPAGPTDGGPRPATAAGGDSLSGDREL